MRSNVTRRNRVIRSASGENWSPRRAIPGEKASTGVRTFPAFPRLEFPDGGWVGTTRRNGPR